MTGAHKSLPFGTIIKVTRLDTKKAIRIRINDRGPYIKGRIVDLSRKAAEQLDLIKLGEAKVKIEVVGKGEVQEVTTTVPTTRTKVEEYGEI